MKHRLFGILVAAAAAVFVCSGPHLSSTPADGDTAIAKPARGAGDAPAGYDDLVTLFREFRELQKPVYRDGVPDYTPAAIRSQAEGLAVMQRRLAAIDSSAWPPAYKVDYMLVKAEMNGLEFEHRVLKPWALDPAWWIVVSFQFGPKMHDPINLPRELPVPDDRLATLRLKLKAVPGTLQLARETLSDCGADLTMLGIRSKEREGRMLADFETRVAPHHPELVADVRTAREAVEAFRGWLETKRDVWTKPSGIGVDNYNWYLRNVQLLPYSWESLKAISEREYERAMGMMKLEEHRNRKLPPFKLVLDEEEMLEYYNRSQDHLVEFLKSEEVMTVPDFVRPLYWNRWRPSSPLDYFANVQARDPLPLQPHDTVGHRPDAERHRQDDRPIRGARRLYFIDGTRAEALATGMEEILMHLGMLQHRPRGRELAYNLLAFRAARSVSDLLMHANEMTLLEGYQFNIDDTPYGWLPQDSPTMWHDIELYMRQPTYGVGYLIGSVQLQKLIADRGRQLGAKFVLKDLMDAFYASGMIPMALIRYELTGLDDEVRTFLR